MIDKDGNIASSEKTVEKIAIKTYKKRLENRKIKENLKELKDSKEELCKFRLKAAGRIKTQDWTMAQLDKVLKYLKKNKNRDPFGYANDIFHLDVAGENLKQALLIMMNRIKKE